MTVANYINDLLYRYDCVIVPNFGGFITNQVGAKVNNSSHKFYPPTKQISFNYHLIHNDGLLANYIASSENISFERATEKIASTVKKWQTDVASNTIEISGVGTLSYNKEKQLVFEPTPSVNYLTDAFGLVSYNSPTIKRVVYKQQVKPLLVAEKEGKKVIPMFIKYAVTAAILVTLGFVGWNGILQKNQQKLVAKQEKALEQKIQTATFVISNPLPTINLTVKKIAPKKYHIIAGAFQFEENAAKKVAQLKQKGFNARILGKNKWGLTQVAYSSCNDRLEALSTLKKMKQTVSKEVWLFVMK